MCVRESVNGCLMSLVKYGQLGRLDSSVPLAFEPIYSIFFIAY